LRRRVTKLQTFLDAEAGLAENARSSVRAGAWHLERLEHLLEFCDTWSTPHGDAYVYNVKRRQDAPGVTLIFRLAEDGAVELMDVLSSVET
jgi:hypothetical protein